MRYTTYWLIALILEIANGCVPDVFSPNEVPIGKPTDLSYAQVTDAREGELINSSTPTLMMNGGTPSFMIAGGSDSLGLLSVEELSNFTINKEDGQITIPDGNNLKHGHYQIDVLVATQYPPYVQLVDTAWVDSTLTLVVDTIEKYDIVETLFKRGFALEILPSLIGDLHYSPSKVSFERSVYGESAVPTYKGDPDSIHFYLEKSKYSSYFSIDSIAGVISLPDTSTIDIGHYDLGVDVINLSDSMAVFNDILSVDIVSKPYKLTYEPKIESKVQEYAPRTTQKPKLMASNLSSIRYSLPIDVADSITIDSITGAVSLSAFHNYKSGEKVMVDVIVSNDYGVETFKDAVGFEIVPQTPVPPRDITYSSDNLFEVQQTRAFQSPVPQLEGAYPIEFSIESGNESNQFQIDSENGVISLPNNHTLEIGKYSLLIKAKNKFGESTCSLQINIIEVKKTIVFDDGFTASSTANGKVGNLKQIDLDNNRYVTNKGQYKKGWAGDKSIWNTNNTKSYGVSMWGDKEENSDWLIVENLNLGDISNTELLLNYYMAYADKNDKENDIEIKVSTDYIDNVENVHWISIANLGKEFPSTMVNSTGYIKATEAEVSQDPDNYVLAEDYVTSKTYDLSNYDGKTITIAVHAYHHGKESVLSRATFISKIQVKGINMRESNKKQITLSK